MRERSQDTGGGPRLRLQGHKDRSLSYVEEYKPGLMKLPVGRWNSDLVAIRGKEGRA